MTLWRKICRLFTRPVSGACEEGEERQELREGAPPEEDSFPDAVQITNELDLHGFFPEQVPEVMEEFLSHAVELGIEEVRIAHGKGRSVMKREVWKLLERDRRVIAFREAPPGRGGWGATLARLVRRAT